MKIYGDRLNTEPRQEKLIIPLQFALLDVQRATRCNSFRGYRNNSAIFHIVFHLTVENPVTELERLLRTQEHSSTFTKTAPTQRAPGFWRMAALADILII